MILVVAWFVAIVMFEGAYVVLHEYHLGHWAPGALLRSIVLTAVLVVVCISSAAMVTGRRSARNIFLAASTILALGGTWDGLLIVQYALSAPVRETLGAWSWPQWWAFSTPLLWIAWLAGNYWYLTGKRARDFFFSR
ncbi:MAG: hypothetical protein KDI87_06200 [Gammaproteobacteria bacterium]|nr:hypothetical protein [Gammaproteobacteria bacterium]